jgi:hypothetical protein
MSAVIRHDNLGSRTPPFKFGDMPTDYGQFLKDLTDATPGLRQWDGTLKVTKRDFAASTASPVYATAGVMMDLNVGQPTCAVGFAVGSGVSRFCSNYAMNIDTGGRFPFGQRIAHTTEPPITDIITLPPYNNEGFGESVTNIVLAIPKAIADRLATAGNIESLGVTSKVLDIPSYYKEQMFTSVNHGAIIRARVLPNKSILFIGDNSKYGLASYTYNYDTATLNMYYTSYYHNRVGTTRSCAILRSEGSKFSLVKPDRATTNTLLVYNGEANTSAVTFGVVLSSGASLLNAAGAIESSFNRYLVACEGSSVTNMYKTMVLEGPNNTFRNYDIPVVGNKFGKVTMAKTVGDGIGVVTSEIYSAYAHNLVAHGITNDGAAYKVKVNTAAMPAGMQPDLISNGGVYIGNKIYQFSGHSLITYELVGVGAPPLEYQMHPYINHS